MKLQVNVVKARGLVGKDKDGSSDPYVKLELGRTKTNTAVIHKCLNPVWNQEFSFTVQDLKSELSVTVLDDGSSGKNNFLGQVKLPLCKVLHSEKNIIPAQWYPLQRRSSNSKSVVSGEILLVVSLYGRLSNVSEDSDVDSGSSIPGSPSKSSVQSSGERNRARTRFGEKISALFAKKPKTSPNGSSLNVEEGGESSEEDSAVPVSFFDEDGSTFTISPAHEGLPPPLSGGILLDQTYATSMRKLNAVLFKTGSPFLKEVCAVQKTLDLCEGNWTKLGSDNPKRHLTFTMAASSFLKAVKATEEQTILQADDRGIVVVSTVSTPDVIYGRCFKTEVQFCMTPVPGKQEQCRLRVSWRVNFLQNTMMKVPIESGARKGLRESYRQYAEVLSKYVRPVSDSDSCKGEQNQIDAEPKSDLELIKEIICNPVVWTSLLLLVLVLVHIYMAAPTLKTGLEFWDLDLPDSLTEFLTSAAVTYQLMAAFRIASRFLRARFCVVGDHGIKAKGDGWLLTVTLVEGENLPVGKDIGCLDPFVVFSCGGKSRRSSVKLQTTNPKWNEVFEFDAMEDPPSTLDVEVFNYDGPFATMSLGYGEINFLKSKSEDLADIWVDLRGKAAQASGSRLRLRVFLTSTKEADTIVEYVKKVEKEIGTKITSKSKKNATFQKIFSLPAEEFLISDFGCAVKRKMPLQGRIFLSPRMLGFYSNIFGHKTKFSMLWTDIEDVQELPPSLANVGPSIVLYTRRGRALDASNCAKSTDVKGRLMFQFQSFVHPVPAFRMLMILWKNRTLSPEQRLQILENVEAENKFSDPEQQFDNNGDFLGVDDATLSEVFAITLPFTVASVIMLYDKENLEVKIMGKLGCPDFVASSWVNAGRDSLQQRQVSYKLDRQLCQFGSIVTGIQQMELSEDRQSVTLEEILRLHDVPYGDNFQIHAKSEIQTMELKPGKSSCKVFVGIVWQKETPMQSRITDNVYKHFTDHLKDRLNLSIDELLAYKDRHEYVLL